MQRRKKRSMLTACIAPEEAPLVRIALLVLLVWSPVSLAASEVEALLWSGRVAEALPAAQAEAEAAPADLAAHERYIDILLSLGMPSLADATYRERLGETPDADSHYLLGRAVITAEEAQVLYGEALRLDLDNMFRIQIDLTSISAIKYFGEGIKDTAVITLLNNTCHLADLEG